MCQLYMWWIDCLQGPWISIFHDLEDTGGAYEIKKFKPTVKIKRHYKCGIAVYKLAKLWMLEIYYDLFDNYLYRQDFELCCIDLAMSDEPLDEIAKPGLRQADDVNKRN